jgi:hypothetical protein
MSDSRLVVDNGWLGLGPGDGGARRTRRASGLPVHRPDDQGDEQSLDLVAGERDEPVRCGLPGLFDGADNGEAG